MNIFQLSIRGCSKYILGVGTSLRLIERASNNFFPPKIAAQVISPNPLELGGRSSNPTLEKVERSRQRFYRSQFNLPLVKSTERRNNTFGLPALAA
jgi:hypothetical protein